VQLKKISGKKIIASTAILLSAVLVGYFWRDLHLGDNSGKIKVPDVVVENIEVERVIGGKHWKLVAPRLEHKDGVISAVSLDILIAEKNGKKSKVSASKSSFARDNNDITMDGVNAVMADKKKEYTFSAGAVKYDAAKEIWHFSKAIVFKDGPLKIEGTEGSYETKKGICSITNGGTVTWSK